MLERSTLEHATLKSLKQAASLGFIPKQIIPLNTPPSAKKSFYTITFAFQPIEHGNASMLIEQQLALNILKAYGFENPQQLENETIQDGLKEFGELIFGNLKNILPPGSLVFEKNLTNISFSEEQTLIGSSEPSSKQFQFYYLFPPNTLSVRFSISKEFEEKKISEPINIPKNSEAETSLKLDQGDAPPTNLEVSEIDIAAIDYYFQSIKKTTRDLLRRPKAFRRLRFRLAEVEHSLFQVNRERKGGAWLGKGVVEIDPSNIFECCFFLNQSLLSYCLGITTGFSLEKIEEWVRHAIVNEAEPNSIQILFQNLLQAYEAIFTKIFQRRVFMKLELPQFTKLRDLMLLDDHKQYFWLSNSCELFVHFAGTSSLGISQKMIPFFIEHAYKAEKMIKKSKQLEKDRKKAKKDKENRKIGKKTLILHSSFRMNYQFMKGCIDENMYRTYEVEDVEACMMLFRKYFIHAIVLGINSPNDKSFEVVDSVRNSEQVWKTPIVAMAMKPSKDIIVASMQRGADKFMVCPTPKDLFNKGIAEIVTEKFL